MTEEEKKAIEYWKTHIEILHWNTQLASEHYLKVLLNLIEKQQKEIQKEKEKNKEQYKEFIKDHGEVCEKLKEDINKEWEDKIKAKIEEVEPFKKVIPKDNNYTYKELIEYGIELLQSLLEEKE